MAVEVFGPQPSNDAAPLIEYEEPYTVEFELRGTAKLLYHRWSNEAVKEKAEAKKGSAAKKTDNVESYVYRDDDGYIAVPGEWVRAAMCQAAKFKQDPRSPRKSAFDLYNAALVPLTEFAPILVNGKRTKKWDYMDERRVTVQRNSVTRMRPGFYADWTTKLFFEVVLPEYVSEHDFLEVLGLAGRVQGIGDFRPSHGRFLVVHFDSSRD